MNNQSFLRFSEEISNFSETTHLPEPFHTKKSLFPRSAPVATLGQLVLFWCNTKRLCYISSNTKVQANLKWKEQTSFAGMHYALSVICWLLLTLVKNIPLPVTNKIK